MRGLLCSSIPSGCCFVFFPPMAPSYFRLCFFVLAVYYIIRLRYFFFFKQKTAYEMRISDWSSDVCSSDLRFGRMIMSFHRIIMLPLCTALLVAGCQEKAPTPPAGEEAGHDDEDGEIDLSAEQIHRAGIELVTVVRGGAGALTVPATRSEEHTSELQSLMRISYAVFCLKK